MLLSTVQKSNGRERERGDSGQWPGQDAVYIMIQRFWIWTLKRTQNLLLSLSLLLQFEYLFFLLSFNTKLDQDKRSRGLTSLEGKWLVVSLAGGGCIEYVLCFPFSQTNNFEINVHNYLWPPLLRTTAIKLINRGRLSVSLDCCVIRGGHK